MGKMKIDSGSNKEQVVNKLPNATSCFVAGTLVHTNQGLVPIEQLKVGDMVLSMPESGPTKDKAYKRVVKTFKSRQKQPIMSPVSDIYCTDNHPFWTKDEGWKAAKFLDRNTDKVYALGMDGAGCYDYPQYVTNGKGYWRDLYEIGGLYLLPTPIDGIAACLETNDYNIRSENHASLIDFRNGQQQYICSTNGFSDLYALSPDKYNQVAKSIYSRVLYEAIEGEGVNQPFSAYVYNIEVEDYHTYFVGEIGYWVHDL